MNAFLLCSSRSNSPTSSHRAICIISTLCPSLDWSACLAMDAHMSSSPRCIQAGPHSSQTSPFSFDSNSPPKSVCHDDDDADGMHLLVPSVLSKKGAAVSDSKHSLQEEDEDNVDLDQRRKEEQPPWVSVLLETKFYGPCRAHASLRKNDLNLFCTDHCKKICQYCHNEGHSDRQESCSVLHVSRYMYHDVLLLKEAAIWLDIADVQSYLNNGNRVVYIDRRAQAKSKLAPHSKSCMVCSRTLQDPYRFCSVFCRLAHGNSDTDSSAVIRLPVPVQDPLVLVHSPVRRVAKRTADAGLVCSQSPVRRRDRSSKRHARRSPTGSVPRSPSTPVRPATVVPSCPLTPPLRIDAAIKKHRRKSQPQLSPLSSPPSIILFHQAMQPLNI